MGFGINRVEIFNAGVTKDAEVSFSSNGNARCPFSIAYTKSIKQDDGQYRDIVSYFDCVIWGKYAEMMGPKLLKGKRVAIEGELTQRSYQANDGTTRKVVEIVCSTVLVIDRQENSGGQGGNNYDTKQPADNGSGYGYGGGY